MNPNLTNLCKLFEAKQMSFEAHPDEDHIRTSFKLQHFHAPLVVHMGEKSDHMVLIVTQPALVHGERRPDVAEFLHRANRSLHLGAFEMDFDDGEVRLRTGIMLEDGGIVTDAFWWKAMAVALGTSDSMFEVLMQVSLNRMPPITACEQFEAAMEHSFSSTEEA